MIPEHLSPPLPPPGGAPHQHGPGYAFQTPQPARRPCPPNGAATRPTPTNPTAPYPAPPLKVPHPTTDHKPYRPKITDTTAEATQPNPHSGNQRGGALALHTGNATEPTQRQPARRCPCTAYRKRNRTHTAATSEAVRLQCIPETQPNPHSGNPQRPQRPTAHRRPAPPGHTANGDILKSCKDISRPSKPYTIT